MTQTDKQVSGTPSFRYPCTGLVQTEGFGAYLEEQLGPPRHNIRTFADELSTHFDVPYLSLVNSGSSANLAASFALAEKTGPGEALVAGFTFPTTMTSLLTAGYRVKIVDTTPGTFNLSPQALEQAISSETKVICVTHFLGFPAELAAIRALCDKHNLLLLQDACESQHLLYEGKAVHHYGDLTTWSFYHPHHLSAFGGGGVISLDEDTHKLVESITHWGRACTCHFDPSSCEAPEGMYHNFYYVRRGHNLEMSELNACFGRFQLRQWPTFEAKRKEHYNILWEALRDCGSIEVYPALENNGSPFVFPITLKDKEVLEVSRSLAERGVETRNLMGGVIADQPAFQDLPTDGLQHCRALAKTSIFVGIHQTLTTEDVHDVAKHLRAVLS
ncbi:MAG: hypothetical protein CL920_09665 [Deltaproteobacteria bacterium]|nr:hypothetical protein [Deltaproteobacteria bacterium]|tara:strand:+ start:2012 stop:3175 length:1164 start_codon:yes stop_codon:yes gene_type:complete